MGRIKICVCLLIGICVVGIYCGPIEHNLPEGVELVDPKDLGLDSQIDLDKLLNNVKALPIDGNALSSALGKPGLKTQVLTVGFDGSEGINLDDFELPQLKNDEHGPLAQAAFSSFKNFIKNSTNSQQEPQSPPQQESSTTRPVKKRTMMRRRKVRVNATTPAAPVESRESPTEPQSPPASSGPKVIELDSSQIEKLIASGKIGPPKSLTPGGPQIIELGQRDLDALLSGENGPELKQILETGQPVNDFDVSQFNTQPRIQVTTEAPSDTTTVSTEAIREPPQTTPVYYTPTVQANIPVTQNLSTAPPPPPPESTLPPIIYQYNSAQDTRSFAPQTQQFQSQVPLLQYQGSINGQEQSKVLKHPTFDLISAPPVSFSTSVLPYKTTFISPQSSSHFIPSNAPIVNEVDSQNKQVFQHQLHQVNIPVNSVKLVTPSPQVVQNLLSSVPSSFAPTSSPNHVVNSPVLNPLSFGTPSFSNTQLFNSSPKRPVAGPPQPPPPPPPRNSILRFPGGSVSGPNRFRTSETTNPHFTPNLVLNSFIPGDGLNYRPSSNTQFKSPGI